MSYLDVEFVHRVAPMLERFREVQKDPVPLYNFRCPSSPPFCGDSQTSKTKARAYFHSGGGKMFFHCHNCGLHMHLSNFLKDFAPDLHSEYLAASLASKGPRANFHHTVVEDEEPPANVRLTSAFVRVDDLDPSNEVLRYVRQRRIPQTKWKYLYGVDDAREIGKLAPKYADRIKGSEPRLVLPVYNEARVLIAVVARAVTPDAKLRYINAKFVEDQSILYGIERVVWSSPVYVVEGPIDSLFLPNAVAVAGSDLKKVKDRFPKQTTTLVFDNQPRNTEIVRKLQGCIDLGWKVCIWPETPGKDINEMILNGWTAGQVRKVIDDNSFHGLEASLRLGTWKRTRT